MRYPPPIIGVTVVLLLVRFVESRSDILPSLPTDFLKFLILQNHNNGVTALVNLILRTMVAVA